MMQINNEEYSNALEMCADSVVELENLKNKRILITGASGLIGSAIVDFLCWLNLYKDYQILIFAAGRNLEKLKDRFETAGPGLILVYYDAEQPLLFDEVVDYVIHCAGNAHPLACVKYPVETMTANLFGTQQLLDHLRKMGTGRMVYVSSSEVYGQKKSSEMYKEKDSFYLDNLNPRACYPSSKRAAETMCSCYAAEYSVDSVIVRPGHIYGPTMTREDSRAYAQFARNALENQDIIMKSEGKQLRSYCYVFDCVSAILSVLLVGKSGEAYNISNKDSVVSIRELAETFAADAGKRVIFSVPDEIEKKGYNLMDNSALDAEKLEKLGWKGKYNLKQGVHSMLEIMKHMGI